MHYKQLTAIIHKEDDVYVSLCPELDIASQGANIEEAKSNIKEAVELFIEYASEEEINQRCNLIGLADERSPLFAIDRFCTPARPIVLKDI